jgi:hypothetical protein
MTWEASRILKSLLFIVQYLRTSSRGELLIDTAEKSQVMPELRAWLMIAIYQARYFLVDAIQQQSPRSNAIEARVERCRMKLSLAEQTWETILAREMQPKILQLVLEKANFKLALENTGLALSDSLSGIVSETDRRQDFRSQVLARLLYTCMAL